MHRFGTKLSLVPVRVRACARATFRARSKSGCNRNKCRSSTRWDGAYSSQNASASAAVSDRRRAADERGGSDPCQAPASESSAIECVSKALELHAS